MLQNVIISVSIYIYIYIYIFVYLCTVSCVVYSCTNSKILMEYNT